MTKLTITTQIVTDTKIVISSDNTIFCNQSLVAGDFDTLQSAYRSLVADAKAAGTKIVYKYRTASRISALKTTLPKAKAQHVAFFRLLRLGWKLKLQAGLSSPTCYDKQLAKLTDLERRFNATMHHTSPVAQMAEILHDLQVRRDALSPDTTIYL